MERGLKDLLANLEHKIGDQSKNCNNSEQLMAEEELAFRDQYGMLNTTSTADKLENAKILFDMNLDQMKRTDLFPHDRKTLVDNSRECMALIATHEEQLNLEEEWKHMERQDVTNEQLMSDYSKKSKKKLKKFGTLSGFEASRKCANLELEVRNGAHNMAKQTMQIIVALR
ncbi:hypothetical protein QR680_001271 [Steinernema hermaphroditum]|uniref:Uncharacterized protein n=1 Tax=Steinernema hermaphroditum TaxID=289476 RepID=A0AA39LFK0_9BILA|nr:hypothetical protein QR680_001271 [Steinernema hermaphroditum]